MVNAMTSRTPDLGGQEETVDAENGAIETLRAKGLLFDTTGVKVGPPAHTEHDDGDASREFRVGP